MGFFSKLKNQVLWQQEMELVALEACEFDERLNPKIFKDLIRTAISAARDLHIFEFPMNEDYRDKAYMLLNSILEAKYKDAVQKGNYGIADEIICYYRASLTVSDVPHLKLSVGAKTLAQQTLQKLNNDYLRAGANN